MKIINDIGDEAIYRAIVAKNSRKPDTRRLHVTELIDSPQIMRLKIEHWNDITIPASSFLFSLTGNLTHKVLEEFAPDNALSEERFSLKHPSYPDIEIVGTPDTYSADGVLTDYKTTSLWSFMHGVKEEWENQMNVYALMLEQNGFQVSKLQVKAILRDWTASHAKRDKDYPQIPFKTIDVPLWANSKKIGYVAGRLFTHQEAVSVCSDKERWKKNDTWAVIKKGVKTAKAVFGTETRPGGEAEAEKMCAELGKGHSVVLRPGGCGRCEAYCIVSEFCPQWAATKKEILDKE